MTGRGWTGAPGSANESAGEARPRPSPARPRQSTTALSALPTPCEAGGPTGPGREDGREGAAERADPRAGSLGISPLPSRPDPEARLRIEILGAPRVELPDGRELQGIHALTIATIALLTREEGPIGRRELRSAVWGPAGTASTLRTELLRLRRLELAPGWPSGPTLELPATPDVDWWRCVQLLDAGATAEALRLVRGLPFGGMLPDRGGLRAVADAITARIRREAFGAVAAALDAGELEEAWDAAQTAIVITPWDERGLEAGMEVAARLGERRRLERLWRQVADAVGGADYLTEAAHVRYRELLARLTATPPRSGERFSLEQARAQRTRALEPRARPAASRWQPPPPRH